MMRVQKMAEWTGLKHTFRYTIFSRTGLAGEKSSLNREQ